jgi:hypothetical protein
MNKKVGFIFLYEWQVLIDSLGLDNKQAELNRALIKFDSEGIETEVFSDPQLRVLYKIFTLKIFENKEKWNEVKTKRAISGKMGGLKKAANLANLANLANARKTLQNVQELELELEHDKSENLHDLTDSCAAIQNHEMKNEQHDFRESCVNQSDQLLRDFSKNFQTESGSAVFSKENPHNVDTENITFLRAEALDFKELKITHNNKPLTTEKQDVIEKIDVKSLTSKSLAESTTEYLFNEQAPNLPAPVLIKKTATKVAVKKPSKTTKKGSTKRQLEGIGKVMLEYAKDRFNADPLSSHLVFGRPDKIGMQIELLKKLIFGFIDMEPTNPDGLFKAYLDQAEFMIKNRKLSVSFTPYSLAMEWVFEKVITALPNQSTNLTEKDYSILKQVCTHL